MNPDAAELPERVERILRKKGLTIHQLSQRTRIAHGRSSQWFIPHNLYYALRTGVSPSLQQLFSLSRISDYRFYDWLRVFGLDPEHIITSQTLLSPKRTFILDSTILDPDSWIPWFRARPREQSLEIAPLGRLLDALVATRTGSLTRTSETENFVYAKIGREDTLAFPELLPGSIVRADVRSVRTPPFHADARKPEPFVLVDCGTELSCCRMTTVNGKQVVLPVGPYQVTEAELPSDSRFKLVGVVDLEIRPLHTSEPPALHFQSMKRENSQAVLTGTGLSQLLRNGRKRAGLSFREASALSRQIALRLGNDQYFIASGSLSDYEAMTTPPRHAHKAITLCAVYGLRFSLFLESIGIDLRDAGRDPIPDELVPRKIPAFPQAVIRETNHAHHDDFLQRVGPIPFFLRDSLTGLSGIANLSLNDFFWVGEEREPLHPLLQGALVVVVNRRKKKPVHLPSAPFWQQPLYVLLKRDGGYLCSPCNRENNALVVYHYSRDLRLPKRITDHMDAEVVGQVVVLARKL